MLACFVLMSDIVKFVVLFRVTQQLYGDSQLMRLQSEVFITSMVA